MNNVQRRKLEIIIDGKIEKACELIDDRYDDIIENRKREIAVSMMPESITKFNAELAKLLKKYRKDILAFESMVEGNSTISSSSKCLSDHYVVRYLNNEIEDNKVGYYITPNESNKYGYYRSSEKNEFDKIRDERDALKEKIKTQADKTKFELYMGNDKDEALKMLEKFDEQLAILLN